MTRLALLLFLLVLISTTPAAYGQPRTISGPATAIDGDTLRLGSVKVRLAGLHAPERHDPGGPEATAWMRRTIAGRIVTCVLDGSRTRDRWAGVCRVDGRDLAEGLIAAGWGRDCPRYSGGRYRRFERPEAVRLGLPQYCYRK